MRYQAPARNALNAEVFQRMPLVAWREYAGVLGGEEWPPIATLNALLPERCGQRFCAQSADLLADNLHYEQRIAERGLIATREGNWHDLLNALVWLRYPDLKLALNRRQVHEIACMGAKQRSRAQYALTQFDEGGVIVVLRDSTLLPLWDAHDWYRLFWTRRDAWSDGAIEIILFGHALLEQALTPSQLLVGKALVFHAAGNDDFGQALKACVDAITVGRLLRDPQELRPLPLAGIPGWRSENADEAFHRTTACYQPRRPGRRYPPAQVIIT